MDPVDTYARLKSDIRALEDQAADLRASFLRPGARLRSNQFEVVIRQQTRRSFQKDLLPPNVLNDPKYWSETAIDVVTLRPLSIAVKSVKDNDEIVLIEPY